MAKVLIYTKESVSSKYRQLALNGIISALNDKGVCVLPHQIDRIDVIGDDNDFSKMYNGALEKFIKNTMYSTDYALKKGDIIKVDRGEVITFSHYDTNVMCIVSTEGGQYLKYIEHTTEEFINPYREDEPQDLDSEKSLQRTGMEILVSSLVIGIMFALLYFIGSEYYIPISAVLLGMVVSRYLFLRLDNLS